MQRDQTGDGRDNHAFTQRKEGLLRTALALFCISVFTQAIPSAAQEDASEPLLRMDEAIHQIECAAVAFKASAFVEGFELDGWDAAAARLFEAGSNTMIKVHQQLLNDAETDELGTLHPYWRQHPNLLAGFAIGRAYEGADQATLGFGPAETRGKFEAWGCDELDPGQKR